MTARARNDAQSEKQIVSVKNSVRCLTNDERTVPFLKFHWEVVVKFSRTCPEPLLEHLQIILSKEEMVVKLDNGLRIPEPNIKQLGESMCNISPADGKPRLPYKACHQKVSRMLASEHEKGHINKKAYLQPNQHSIVAVILDS